MAGKTPAQFRDPWLHPFASTSIWNMPIGSEVKFVPAGLGPAKTIGIDHERFFRVASNAPVRPVFAPKGWETRAGGTRRLGDLPIDDGIVVPDARKGYTPNECAAFLMPDGRTVKQVAPLCRPEAGGPVFGYYFRPDEDLHGAGITGSHGGSGLSALGGSIRLGELTNDAPIRHALKVDIFCKRYGYYGPDRKGFRWPATRADSYAAKEYGGTNRAVVMGTLLALPPDVRAESLALQTPVGRKLFRALQDYGAYVVDDAAWDCHYLCAEFGVAEEVERAYGLKFNGGSKELRHDINALFAALAVVDNNAPDRIGGGGTPRVALAEPLAAQPATPAPRHEPVTKAAPAATTDKTFAQLAVKNPSMTDGKEKPDHWTSLYVTSGQAKISRDTATYHSAPASLALESVGGGAHAQASQFFDVQGGERVRLSGWVRADGGANAMLALQSFSADWKGLDLKIVGNAITGLDWQKAAGEVTVPAAAKRAAIVLLIQGRGTAWLDDVTTGGADPGQGAQPKIVAKPKPQGPPKPANAWSPGEGFYPDYPDAWRQVVDGQVKRAKEGGGKVIFIGDSLTQGWDKELWKARWEPLGAVNFGVGGDGTPQVLERIRRGILDGYTARVVVLNIGINNEWPGYKADDTIKGIATCVEAIQAKQPKAKILLVGITPIFDAKDGVRKKFQTINAASAKLADGERVRFLDFGAQLLDPDGSRKKGFYHDDRLHLKQPAYAIWADAMEPVLKEMLK
jgi:lysophospholipase L1-like esterase